MTKVIAIDLGTTLVKCFLYDETGKTLASQNIPCTLSYPDKGYVEQDANLWYESVCAAIKNLINGYDAKEIEGISISSQGISIVPVDENFHPLYNAISWLDSRALEECETLKEKYPEEKWFGVTGKFISPLYTLPKLLWFKNNKPEIFNSAYKFLMPMDYVNARMTSVAVSDHTMASGTMLYNVKNNCWDQDILSTFGISPDLLPEIQESGTLVGSINEETALKTGLCLKTKVYNGAQDQKVAAFGAEITERRASLSLGTAGALEIFVKDAAKQTYLPFFPYVKPENTIVEGCINTTGAAIQWFKDTIAPEVSFDELNVMADNSPVGSNGTYFYPHLSTPGTPHKSKDEYGSIKGISLKTNKGDLFRCLFEGLAYEIRLNLEYAQKAGSDLTELVVFGGAAKSNVFCQIIANVTNLKTVATQNGEMGGIGAAKFVIEGLRKDGDAFARFASGEEKNYLPDEKAVNEYNKLYNQYIKHYGSEE